jgi:tRNA (cytidine/uridine-2'-O-)-methyltransferase
VTEVSQAVSESDPFLHVVLVEPEIPQNTGTIGRLCLATRSKLHLVKPLGFEITASRLKRAGLDYWEHLNVQVHENIDEFLESMPPEAPRVFVETRASKTIYEHRFEPGTYIILGRETSGLPDWLLSKYTTDVCRLPMWDARVRSLNLSNCASIVVYEALRQIHLS